jgi:hypothetical protein
MDRNEIIAARFRSRAIGRELRERYRDTVEERIPDDMIELLRQIDEKNDLVMRRRFASRT